MQASRTSELYLRLIITRGEGEIGLDPALAVDPHVIVIVRALHPPPPEVYRDGVEVAVVDVRRNLRQAIDPAAKTGNYLNSVLALREARARGAYEALMLDTTGRVTEGSSSNVFAVLGGRVVTPPLEGILEGSRAASSWIWPTDWGCTRRRRRCYPRTSFVPRSCSSPAPSASSSPSCASTAAPSAPADQAI